MNPRLFEAAGAGACQLVDAKTEIPDLYDVPREVVCFTSFEECERLVGILNKSLAGRPGAEVLEVQGILNGTTNFILSKMELENMDYADALALAQKLGYAEADPTADVEGYDALAKIVILSNVLLGAELTPADVKRQGITALTGEQIQIPAKKVVKFRVAKEVKTSVL